jgi:nucleoside-diphosphate-sugar epimerase
MKVVITGGAGFIGFRLARRLLEIGEIVGPSGGLERIEELLLFDADAPRSRLEKPGVDVTAVTGDIADRDAVFGLVDRDDISVFHLASVVSGGGEKDFDLAMRVNLDGGRHVFEALRARGGVPRVVFASSIAVFGGPAMPPSVGDGVKQTPQTTYGVTKSICELLINDYTRKGYLDGRSARLPTVIIRPGSPNAAASSFVSGVFREPLNGADCILPVGADTVMPVLGYRAVVEGLMRLHDLDGAALGADRAVSFPSHTVAVQDMIDALRRVAGNRHLGQITIDPDPFIEEIVKGWPRNADFERATALGLPIDRGLDEIVAYYIKDYLQDC